MRSIKRIARGEEIFNDYGQLPRSDLLRRYGYITDNYTPYDVAELSTKDLVSLFQTNDALLGLNMTPLSKEELEHRVSSLATCSITPNSHIIASCIVHTNTYKVELAEREGIYEDSYDVSRSGPDGPSIPDELLALLYLILLNDESLEALYNSDGLPSRSKLATELVGKYRTFRLSPSC